MFRGLSLFAIVATLVLGFCAQSEALPSSNSTLTRESGPEEPVPPLATEKQQLEKEICDTSKAQNATGLDTENGPKKVVVTEKKVEEFPENVTKEVTVTKKAEKGPSNETQENTVVERKTVQEIDSDSDNPKKNVTIEIESENKVCDDNATEEVTKPTAELVKTNQSKEEAKTTSKVVPVNETEEVENEMKEHEHESCDQLRREVVIVKSVNRKLLAALRKVLMRMTPAKREETAKMIMREAVEPVMAAAGENATHVEAETPTAATPKQETKTIIVKEATEA